MDNTGSGYFPARHVVLVEAPKSEFEAHHELGPYITVIRESEQEFESGTEAVYIELNERSRPRRDRLVATTQHNDYLVNTMKEAMSYTQHGAIYNPCPTQRRPETHPYACLLQLANPLLIRFEVSPTNTLCVHYLTWQPLRQSPPSQVDGEVRQRHQGYFDSNVRS